MIRFSLRCARDHNFDSWFQSNKAFETLDKANMLSCPVCGDSDVKKNVMTPRVQSSTAASELENKPDFSKALSSKAKVMREFRNFIISNYENVGTDFTSEVRAMHDGEIPRRSVFGDATMEDAVELLDEGIPVAPLPGPDTSKTN